MPRFLVKKGYGGKRQVAIIRIPKGATKSQIAQRRASKFKGYRMVRASSESNALRRSGFIVAKGVRKARFVGVR